MKTTAILIVGGGPCGLAAAIHLSRHKNFHIDVIERDHWPKDKTCGEGILPVGIAELHKLGIDLCEIPGQKFWGIHFHSFGKSLLGKFADQQFGWGIKRTSLSKRLYDQAYKTKNIRLHAQARLKDISLGSLIAAKIFFRESDTIVEKSYDFLLGCDGVHSTVRRILNLKSVRLPLSQRVGMRRHYEGPHKLNYVEVHWFDGGECYLTPLTENLMQVAFMYEPAKIENSSWDTMIARVPAVQKKLAPFAACSEMLAHGPLGRMTLAPIGNKFALLGDAFCFWDGITGEGVSLALKQARMFAKFAPALLQNRLSAKISLYIALYACVSWYVVATFSMLLLSRFVFLRRGMFYLGKFFPGLIGMLIEFSMGFPKKIRTSELPSQQGYKHVS